MALDVVGFDVRVGVADWLKLGSVVRAGWVDALDEVSWAIEVETMVMDADCVDRSDEAILTVEVEMVIPLVLIDVVVRRVLGVPLLELTLELEPEGLLPSWPSHGFVLPLARRWKVPMGDAYVGCQNSFVSTSRSSIHSRHFEI